MKKYVFTALLLGSLILTGCSNKALNDANEAAQAYNTAATQFNEDVSAYNEAVSSIVEANTELQAAIDAAQDSINAGETPYDETTLESLKNVLSQAVSAKVDAPEEIKTYEEITVDEEASKTELKDITEKANSSVEEMAAVEIPQVPDVPDYSDVLTALNDAHIAYTNSIQSLKQVTAPTDDFVIERLQTIETITAIEAVTEDHDPNGKLNKQGGYTGCIYFTDSQVNRSNLYIEAGKEGVIDVGTDGGGAVEIFSTVEDATSRDEYLATFDGGAFASGSHYVVGTCLVRTSDELTGTQQKELTEAITQALILVK